LPRRSRREPEEPKIPIVFSAGGLDMNTGELFEQVEEGKYAYWEEGNIILKEQVLATNKNQFPLEKTPWQLAQVTLPYGNQEKLWSEIRQFIYDHLFLPDPALYDVLTGWIFASWVPEFWKTVPYIFFFGPVASGKTRGLEVLHALSYRAILSSNISSAALFRACQEWHPTIILDETEIYRKTEKIDIIGLLNSGYRKGQCAIRAKNSEQGVTLEVFDVFGFKALAGTEGLASTLESRSIMIRMIKNRRKVRMFVDEAWATDLRSKLLTWRMDKLGIKQLSTTKEELIENTNKSVKRELCERCERFLADATPLNVESGRIQELFQCLIAVANSGREVIMNYAEKMERMRMFEEKASIEAELVEILLGQNLILEDNVVLTTELAETFNQKRSEREKWKSSSIGRIMRRLGFQKAHTRQGNGWLLDVERLHYLKEIYLGGGGPVEKGSHGSHGSPLSQDIRQEGSFKK